MFAIKKFALLCVISVQAIAQDVGILKVNSIVLDPDAMLQAITWRGDEVLVSGTKGSVFYSPDNGEHWFPLPAPADSAALEFRDNQQLANGRLVLMSAGEGGASAIFISDDKGASWQRTEFGAQQASFYDCFKMLDSSQGWLFGDADEAGLFVMSTADGASHWQREPLPFAALPGEGGFASSGTCLTTHTQLGVVIGTGNSPIAHLLIYKEGHWRQISTPISAGEGGGIFSLAQAGDALVVAGGNLQHGDQAAQVWLYQDRASPVWQALPTLPLRGAVYGSAVLDKDTDGYYILASNPQGVVVLSSHDGEWQSVSQGNIWSIACRASYGCIGVGANGLVEAYQVRPKDE